MTMKQRLLQGVTIAALAGLGLSSGAQAATKHHHVTKKAAHAADSGLRNEVRELREQLQALQARLDSQGATQQAQVQTAQATAAEAQQTAQAAQTQAATAQTQAAAATAKVETLPTQVSTSVAAATSKALGGWWNNTTVSGRMYYDTTYVHQESNGTAVPPSGVGFDIKRFYIGVDHKFNDVFSANVTTDFQYSSAISSTELYLKKAYLQAKISPALIIQVGATDLPWVPYVEDLYGYRFVENTLIDRTKFGTSTDWGVHAKGTLPGGIISYAISAIDGAGYKAPLRSSTMDVEGRVSAKYMGLNFGIGGYTGKLGKDTEGAVNVYHSANRFDAVAAYVDPKYRVGVEYFYAENWNSVTSKTVDKSDGYSLFGSYNFDPKTSIFARYDYVKPTKDTASSRKDDYYNVGINFEPVKIIDFALVYKHDKVDNGSLSTSNGTIGGSNNGVYDEVGLWGQVRW